MNLFFCDANCISMVVDELDFTLKSFNFKQSSNGCDGDWFMWFTGDFWPYSHQIKSCLHCSNGIAMYDLFPILPACIYRAAPLEWGRGRRQWPPCQLEEEWRVYGGRCVLRGNTHQGNQKLHEAWSIHFTSSNAQILPWCYVSQL